MKTESNCLSSSPMMPLAVVALILLAGSPLWGGTTGKIRGTVRTETGEALPEASVLIDETRQGAITDKDGFFVILSISPGRYTVTASYIGYQSRSVADVRVSADRASTIDFELVNAPLAGEEVIVTARKQGLIEPDQTASRYTVTAQDLEEVPMIRSLANLLALQPGIDATGSSIIRGGNNSPWSRDVTYYIDGVRLVTGDGGSSNDAGLFEEMNVSSIREVQVIVGGMEAEYGNVQGGVVNIITKDGTKEFTGRLEYKATLPGNRSWGLDTYDRERSMFVRIDPVTNDVISTVPWDDTAWREENVTLPGNDGTMGTSDDEQRKAHQMVDYESLWGHRIEGMLAGPLTSKATWALSASSVRIPSGFANASPYGYFTSQRSEAGLPPSIAGFVNAPRNLRLNAKLTFRPTPMFQMRAGAIFGGARVLQGGRDRGQPFYIDGETASGKSLRRDAVYLASIQHSLSPRTFYTLQVSDFATRIDTADVPKTNHPDIYDAAGSNRLFGTTHAYALADRHRYQLKGELFHQLSPTHFVRAGFDVTRYKVWNHSFAASGAPVYLPPEIASGATSVSSFPEDVDWKYNNNSGFVSWSGLTGNGLPIGRGGTPYEPIQFSAYISDKIEQQGTFMTGGVRFDAFWPEMMISSIPAAHATYMYDTFATYHAVRPGFDPVADVNNPDARYLPIEKAKPLYQISPRFGMATQVMAGLLLRTSYGIYYQIPPLITNYNVRWQGGSTDANGNGQIDDYEWMNQRNRFATDDYQWTSGGNGARVRFPRAEKTLNLEAGLDWNFVSDYTAGLTLYYKQASYQQVGGGTLTQIFEPSGPIHIPMGPTVDFQTTSLATPDGFGDVKGVELAVVRKFKKYFGLRASYNWNQIASEIPGGESFRRLFPDSTSIANGGYWVDWETRLDGSMVPILPDAATLEAWGARVNDGYRRNTFGDASSLDIEDDVPGMQSVKHNGFLVPGSFYVFDPGAPSLAERLHGARQQTGSLLLVFSVPPGVGPSIGSFALFGGWKGNLIYRMATGLEVESYAAPGPIAPGGTSVRQVYSLPTTKVTYKLPMESRVDLSLARTFYKSENGFRADLFAEAVNLFNDRNHTPDLDAASDGVWLGYGLAESYVYKVPTPGNPYGYTEFRNHDYVQKFAQQEDHLEFGTNRENPRHVELGFRLSW